MRRITIVVLLSFLTLFVLPATSHAMTVYADIEGAETFTTQQAPFYIDITGTYVNGCVNYTITSYSSVGLPARIEAIDAEDGSTDTLWLRNVKITNNADSTCSDSGHIYFWAKFSEPPTTSAGQKVAVTRTAVGVFNPSTINNWIAVNGDAQNPVSPDPPDGVSGSWTEICASGTGCQDSYVVTCSTCGNFNKSKQHVWDPALTQSFAGDRVLKGEFSFRLVNTGNTLVFDNSTKGIKIYTTTGAGDKPLCGC